jgi:hypothetical protein
MQAVVTVLACPETQLLLFKQNGEGTVPLSHDASDAQTILRRLIFKASLKRCTLSQTPALWLCPLPRHRRRMTVCSSLLQFSRCLMYIMM